MCSPVTSDTARSKTNEVATWYNKASVQGQYQMSESLYKVYELKNNMPQASHRFRRQTANISIVCY